jgi:hypothetical protein
MAAGGREETEASVALATYFSGRPFATRTPTVGACGLRLDTGALDEKKKPLAPELAMPVWVEGRWVGLQLRGVARAE